MVGARKTTSFYIPIGRFARLKKLTLEKLISKAAKEYNLEENTAISQIKRLIPESKPEDMLNSIQEIYKNNLNLLTTPAKILLTSIISEHAQKKLLWLKNSKQKQKIKKIESLIKEAQNKERTAATTYFLKKQKAFLDNQENSEPEEIDEEDLETQLEIINKRKSKKLTEFVIESKEYNFIEKIYELYDKLQEHHWKKGNKDKCKKISAKKLGILTKHVNYPKNFSKYYYRYAKTWQRIAACSKNKQTLLEKCIDSLEKRAQVDRNFNQIAYIGLGDLYIDLAKIDNSENHLEKASKAYHTALEAKNLKKSSIGVISSKLGNCHISRLRLAKNKKLSERFIDYLQALKHIAEAHYILDSLKSEETADYKKKLGTTLFHLGKDLMKAEEHEFKKITDLLRFYDPMSNEHYENSTDTVIRRVKSIMLPEKYTADQKDYLLLRIFSNAKNSLKKSRKKRSFSESQKISEQIVRSCLYVGRIIERIGTSTTRSFEEARTTLEDMIRQVNQRIEEKGTTKDLKHKLSRYHNFLGETHHRLSNNGNILERVENKIKSIHNYFKTIALKKDLEKDAHPACYSICATNYIDIAEIILDERVCAQLPTICQKLGVTNPEKNRLAQNCYEQAIKLLKHARKAGDYTPNCTAKIGKCHAELAKQEVLENKDARYHIDRAIKEIEKAIKKDLELGNAKDPYLLPHWIKADLASFLHKNNINTLDPEQCWKEFIEKSKRDYLTSITNCKVWRAKGRGAEQVKAIFKSPVKKGQSLKLEKILIESKNAKTDTGYEVKWLLEDPEILIVQSKGTKTMNERINKMLKTLKLAQKIAQKQKTDLISKTYKEFHDETMQLYQDAVTEMVKNSKAIQELYNQKELHDIAKKEGFNLDDEVIRFTLKDYHDFTDKAVDTLNLKFGYSNLSNNTHIGQDIFVQLGEQYEKKHLKAILREITEKCIWPMKDGFDFDPNLDNVMVYDDEENTKVACGIDFEKLKIRKYIAGLCMLLCYDNPSIPKELSEKEEGNFITSSHKKEIIDHFIEQEQLEDRYQVHRDTTVYLPLRRLGLAANEKNKLNENRKLSEEEIILLKKRQSDDIEWLRSDVAYAIKESKEQEPGKLYQQDRIYFTILNDIIKNMEISP